MREYLTTFISGYGLGNTAASVWADIVLVLCVIILSALSYYAVRKIALRAVARYVMNNLIEWDNILLERRVFQRVSYLVPGIVIFYCAMLFPDHQDWIRRLAVSYCIIVALFIVAAVLNSVDELYSGLEVSKSRPIKGYVQILNILVFVVGFILVIANIVGKSPVILLSGLGAMTAVLLLLFKDSILGLVAGIQLATNDMVRIGDWIEMPKYGADGDVIEISLHTVKVENWDRTITSIPSYALVSDSFKNWRGMQKAGGRRIKRSVYIDKTSVVFCTEAMVERFKKIQLLTDYITSKDNEIREYNIARSIDKSEPVNGRQITNLGTLRAYIQCYLRNHPNIRQDMTLMVRQLQPTENGLPLEIYAFTNDTKWVNYEAIQADIFDHVLAIIPYFGLRVFQAPSGYDMRTGLGAALTAKTEQHI